MSSVGSNFKCILWESVIKYRRGGGGAFIWGTVLDTDIKENQNTLLSLHELLYSLIMQRCKLHKVLLIIYTTTLAFLLVEKHDLNLLYK